MSPMASNVNFAPESPASTVNTRSLNDASSQMATEELAPNPSNSGSLTNFGSSSLMAIESPSENFNSGVMGFPAFQTNFGSSAITAGNSPQNRQNLMPSPLNPDAGSASLLNSGVGLASLLNSGLGSASPMNPGVGSASPMNPGVGSASLMNPGVGSASLMNPGVGSASPMNPGVGPIFVSREQITMRSGSGNMQSRMLPRTGNKIYA